MMKTMNDLEDYLEYKEQLIIEADERLSVLEKKLVKLRNDFIESYDEIQDQLFYIKWELTK